MHSRMVGLSQVRFFSRYLQIPAGWLILPTVMAVKLAAGLTKNEAINVICHRASRAVWERDVHVRSSTNHKEVWPQRVHRFKHSSHLALKAVC